MSMPVPSATGSRVATRYKVFLPAGMTGTDGTGQRVRAHLLNLSETGALLHTDAPPENGAIVQVHCGPASWSARVVWTANKRFGVVHATRLSQAAVEALVANKA